MQHLENTNATKVCVCSKSPLVTIESSRKSQIGMQHERPLFAAHHENICFIESTSAANARNHPSISLVGLHPKNDEFVAIEKHSRNIENHVKTNLEFRRTGLAIEKSGSQRAPLASDYATLAHSHLSIPPWLNTVGDSYSKLHRGHRHGGASSTASHMWVRVEENREHGRRKKDGTLR